MLGLAWYTADSILRFDSKTNRTADSIRTKKNDSQVPNKTPSRDVHWLLRPYDDMSLINERLPLANVPSWYSSYGNTPLDTCMATYIHVSIFATDRQQLTQAVEEERAQHMIWPVGFPGKATPTSAANVVINSWLQLCGYIQINITVCTVYGLSVSSPQS